MRKNQKMQELPMINIENGMPSLQEAKRIMAQFINESKHLGRKAIKIIHGYGSSGVGGKLRVGLRQELEIRKRDRKIRDFFPGEQFGRSNAELSAYTNQISQLPRDPDFDQKNPGITIVILG